MKNLGRCGEAAGPLSFKDYVIVTLVGGVRGEGGRRVCVQASRRGTSTGTINIIRIYELRIIIIYIICTFFYILSPAQARHRPRPPHWQAVAARGHATDSARFYIF